MSGMAAAGLLRARKSGRRRLSVFHRLKGNESGQSIVIIAVAMVAIISMAALVLDGGYAYLERRRVQNAADAAALAGARALIKPESETTIRQAIDEYAMRNGITNPSVNIKAYFVDASNNIVPDAAHQVGNGAVPSTASGIVVQAGEQHATFFAQVIGFPTMNISAVAQAGLDPAGASNGAAPVAVKDTFIFNFTDTYTLWDEDKDVVSGDPHFIPGGSRGWLRFPECNGQTYNGASGLKWLMEHGYPCTLSVGEGLVIDAKPGVTASVFKTCELWPETLKVPIYHEIVPGGYKIIKFAGFKWDRGPANDPCPAKIITGRFTGYLGDSISGSSGSWGAGSLRLKAPVSLP
jgi:Flp pilus assembly protein TadG